MNIDVIRESTNLPLLNKGDHVVIHHTGAYNMTQWMQFITLRPNVVMIGPDEKVHLIRNREGLDNMNNMELLPLHLQKF
jgi:diaminopimelate decarboxylase